MTGRRQMVDRWVQLAMHFHDKRLLYTKTDQLIPHNDWSQLQFLSFKTVFLPEMCNNAQRGNRFIYLACVGTVLIETAQRRQSFAHAKQVRDVCEECVATDVPRRMCSEVCDVLQQPVFRRRLLEVEVRTLLCIYTAPPHILVRHIFFPQPSGFCENIFTAQLDILAQHILQQTSGRKAVLLANG